LLESCSVDLKPETRAYRSGVTMNTPTSHRIAYTGMARSLRRRTTLLGTFLFGALAFGAFVFCMSVFATALIGYLAWW
jgi:hypothetical protein